MKGFHAQGESYVRERKSGLIIRYLVSNHNLTNCSDSAMEQNEAMSAPELLPACALVAELVYSPTGSLLGIA